jgi:hypothetical protein
VLVACDTPRAEPTPPPAAKPAACVLAGDYRLRVGDPSQQVTWWQLTVGDGRITKASPAELTTYRVTLDAKSCTLVARVNEGTHNPTVVTLALDPKTGKVSGQESTGHRPAPAPIVGVRDAGAPAMPAPCFVAGVYTLASDAQWTCDPPGRAVGMFTPFETFALRVQPFLGEIVIDRVDSKPPYEPMLGDVTVVRSGCEVTLAMTYGRRMTAKLTFSRDRFDGTVTDMEYGGGDSGGSWQCRVASAKLSGTRVP